jgi:hypothetical protein
LPCRSKVSDDRNRNSDPSSVGVSTNSIVALRASPTMRSG